MIEGKLDETSVRKFQEAAHSDELHELKGALRFCVAFLV